MAGLKVAFAVQGDGRGHMTQALALADHLREAGHEVVKVFLSTNPFRPVPGYFLEEIQAAVQTFPGPALVPDDARYGISQHRTTVRTLAGLPGYVATGCSLVRALERSGADVVVNFLEVVSAMGLFILRSPLPSVSVAHHFTYLLPDAPRRPLSRWAWEWLRFYTWGTGPAAAVRLALSFTPDPNRTLRGDDPWVGEDGAPRRNEALLRREGPARRSGRRRGEIRITPPLLRPAFLRSPLAAAASASGRARGGTSELPGAAPEREAALEREPDAGGPEPDSGRRPLLAYVLNPGMARILAAWHSSRADAPPLDCFLEGGPASLPGSLSPGFAAHDLDGAGFHRRLRECSAYVGTAGFESLAEAHLLGKPVFAIPTPGQMEQRLNARDAAAAGVAVTGTAEDLDAFLSAPPEPCPRRVAAFRRWVERGGEAALLAVEEAARS
ncbi:MAG: glycosyltransferase family protein [Gemmatimonadota bacterium]